MPPPIPSQQQQQYPHQQHYPHDPSPYQGQGHYQAPYYFPQSTSGGAPQESSHTRHASHPPPTQHYQTTQPFPPTSASEQWPNQTQHLRQRSQPTPPPKQPPTPPPAPRPTTPSTSTYAHHSVVYSPSRPGPSSGHAESGPAQGNHTGAGGVQATGGIGSMEALMNAVGMGGTGGPGANGNEPVQRPSDNPTPSAPSFAVLNKKPRRPNRDLLLLDDAHRMGLSAGPGSRRATTTVKGADLDDDDDDDPGTPGSGWSGGNSSSTRRSTGPKRRRTAGSVWGDSGTDDDYGGTGDDAAYVGPRRPSSHASKRGGTPVLPAHLTVPSTDVAWVYSPNQAGTSLPPASATLPAAVVGQPGGVGEGMVVVAVEGQAGCPVCGVVGVDEWVGCDGCERWFHFTCVGMTARLASAADKWYCPPCHTRLGVCTLWKEACANPHCPPNHPSLRSLIVEEGVTPFTSKYCSERCGVEVARVVVEEGKKRKIEEQVEKRVSEEKEAMERDWARKVEEAGLGRDKFRWVDRVPSGDDGGVEMADDQKDEEPFGDEEDGKWTSRFDDEDLAEVRMIRAKKDRCKRDGKEAMRRFELFADYVLKVHTHNENLIVDGLYPMCGFDQIVLAILDGAVSNADGSYEARFVDPSTAARAAAKVANGNVDEDHHDMGSGPDATPPPPPRPVLFPVPYTACRFPPTGCPRHVGWETLKREEIELEVTNLVDELEELRERESEVIAQIGRRALQAGEWSACLRQLDGLAEEEKEGKEVGAVVVTMVGVKEEKKKGSKKKSRTNNRRELVY
ncbi:hypothetical protein M427DRAFT_151904 [Gonapodya prolifera JEL478]|uniref:PHD-type domain-containing protein n=1 Tax=Gonapodya prolifera (strain JEL478) TaxID=1344416 RepID=A0A139AV56_GONPJ|nr:hypothetical protein M427DRAFT_151904 [Gonapodya prolifera JEL478]|eukprot:KXS20612.1 hypothetical protein M427DRAFT_151904 [Gonapodya prolifera JEL478]